MSVDEIVEMQQSRRERMWLAAIISAAIITFIPTFIYWGERWVADTQNSLAFLVPFVCGYFVWKKWPEVVALRRQPSSMGLIIITLALLLHLTAVVLDISGVSGIAVLMCLVGGCLYFHGPALIRTLAFPLAYLVFLVPIPGGVLDLIGFPLQLWASGSAAVLLKFLGIEVVRNGVNMSVEGYNFQVAQACSGLSSLVALIGVTAVFAYLTKLPTVYKWILFLLALPIALAANVVRITTIALVGYQWGPDAATNVYHDWSSPILFMAAIGLLFLINWGFEWLNQRQTTS